MLTIYHRDIFYSLGEKNNNADKIAIIVVLQYFEITVHPHDIKLQFLMTSHFSYVPFYTKYRQRNKSLFIQEMPLNIK